MNVFFTEAPFVILLPTDLQTSTIPRNQILLEYFSQLKVAG